MVPGFDPALLALNHTLNALRNLDTLYADCEMENYIRLIGYKNGKATYTSSIKVSE